MTNAVTGTWLALLILVGSIEQQHLARTTQRIDELTIGLLSSMKRGRLPDFYFPKYGMRSIIDLIRYSIGSMQSII
ncbi:MAG: hypothetical protein J0M26_08820 [Planctomycetes bacterium]|nr:hypothetical protein [Planctomycetota bacterium]